jgi:hypothetical protein
MEGAMDLPFGPLGLQTRRYSALVRDDLKDDSAARAFCAWLAEVGRETERQTLDWARSKGWEIAAAQS